MSKRSGITIEAQEWRSIGGLASVYCVRMLGLFMVLPLLAFYASDYEAATPALIGMAMGVYGLSQGLLQVFYGSLSDFLGRKRVIAFGLIVFIAGSIVCACTQSVYGLIAGRALQGAGAVASVISALVTDQTRDQIRTFAMAIIGMSIGLSFVLSMLLGPWLATFFGLAGVFWVSALLGGAAIVLLYALVPAEDEISRASTPSLSDFVLVLRDKNLLRLNFGIFVLHALLVALFTTAPSFVVGEMNAFYLAMVGYGLLIAIPAIGFAESMAKGRWVFLAAVAALVVVFGLMTGFGQSLDFRFLMALFFAAFMVLEALLPSMVSKTAPANQKGAALGIYSSWQFFGIFVGGAFGGWLYQQFSVQAVFVLALLLAASWLAVAWTMQFPSTSAVPASSQSID